MLVFVDTEFTDFNDCHLISLALVAPNGDEFYVEVNDHPVGARSLLVRDNIMPLLDGGAASTSYDDATRRLYAWLDKYPDQEVTFVVDYHGDWALLRNMILNGREKLDLSPTKNQTITVIFFNFAIADTLTKLGFTSQQAYERLNTMRVTIDEYYQKIDKRVHHALVDARCNLHTFRQLTVI